MAAGQQLDRTLLALADPTRRAILQRLSQGTARVTDIAEPFDMSLNAVSKHIKVLEQARLLKRERVGRVHYLTYEPATMKEVTDWMETTRSFWAASLDNLEALLKEEDRTTQKKRER